MVNENHNTHNNAQANYYGTYNAPGDYRHDSSSDPLGGGNGVGPYYEAARKPPSGQHSILRSGALNQATFLSLGELILVPWLVLVVVLITFFLAGDEQLVAMFIVPGVIVFLTSLFVYNRYTTGNSAEVVLGFLIFTAVLAGVIVGGYANVTAMLEYWRLGRGASYFNVYPEELAVGKSDASTLVFAPGARVDASRTYGFTDGHTREGTLYCVAPISGGDSSSIRVQYWAAGVNCCHPRSNFHCGEATSDTAHGAFVLPKSTRSNPNFAKAISGAQAAYGLQAGDDYMLLEWVSDPMGKRNVLWTNTRTLFLVFAAVYLVISAMVGCGVMPALKQ